MSEVAGQAPHHSTYCNTTLVFLYTNGNERWGYIVEELQHGVTKKSLISTSPRLEPETKTVTGFRGFAL